MRRGSLRSLIERRGSGQRWSDVIEDLGAEPVVADLTGDVSHAVDGIDAIIFAASSGGEDVWGVDRDGATNLIDSVVSIVTVELSADSRSQRPPQAGLSSQRLGDVRECQ